MYIETPQRGYQLSLKNNGLLKTNVPSTHQIYLPYHNNKVNQQFNPICYKHYSNQHFINPKQISKSNKLQTAQSMIINSHEHHNNHFSDKQYQIKHIQNFSYVTNQEIGLGFSSKVYKGKNQNNNQRVAIKVISLQNTMDALQASFLQTEINTLQKISQHPHRNLLNLETVLKTKNNIYIITQFCEGKDIGKVLRKKKKLNQSEAQSVLKQMIEGFVRLCELGIVHRDLKLANLFIKDGILKIADFGFATSLDNCKMGFSYNVGSPHYMSPQALKYNKYSHGSDIWAIGVIAYELVHGKAPWKDKNDAILFEQITKIAITKIIDPQLKLTENYINFIKACLTLDINKRLKIQDLKNWIWNLATNYIEGAEDKVLNKMIPYHLIGKYDKKISESQRNFNSLGQCPRTLQGHLLTQKMYQLGNSGSLEGFLKNPNSIYKNQSTSLTPNSDKLHSNPINPKNQTYWAQQTILSQLHYCRFLGSLYQEIKKVPLNNHLGQNRVRSQTHSVGQKDNIDIIENVEKIKQSIRERVIFKIKALSEMAKTGNNTLNINGFENFSKSENWEKHKHSISQYYHKFHLQFKSKPQSNIDNITNIEQCLLLTIKALKLCLQSPNSNVRLLQLLVFYFQVLKLEQTNNNSSFAKIAKMDLLGGTKLHQSIAIERMSKKLEQIGL